jgi:hypothetical protein
VASPPDSGFHSSLRGTGLDCKEKVGRNNTKVPWGRGFGRWFRRDRGSSALCRRRKGLGYNQGQPGRVRRGVAQSGSASALGAEGRGFKSLRPDHLRSFGSPFRLPPISPATAAFRTTRRRFRTATEEEPFRSSIRAARRFRHRWSRRGCEPRGRRWPDRDRCLLTRDRGRP